MFRIRLLSAASGIALAVAAQGGANASPSEFSDGARAQRPIVTGVIPSDQLFSRLLGLTGGVLTAERVGAAIDAMFPELDREQAQQLPDLMTQIRTLGLVRQTEMAAARHMASRVADSPLLQDAPSLQVELARDILGRLAGPAVAVQVAQSVIDESLCPYEPTDPRYSRDPNCAPLETGAIPDTGGTGTGGTIPGVNAPPNGPENAGTSNGY